MGSGRASGACQWLGLFQKQGHHLSGACDDAQTDVILDPIKLHVKLENGGFRDTLKVVMLFSNSGRLGTPLSTRLRPHRRTFEAARGSITQTIKFLMETCCLSIACAEWPISTVLKVIIAYAAHVMIMPCYIIHRKSLYNILIDIT